MQAEAECCQAYCHLATVCTQCIIRSWAEGWTPQKSAYRVAAGKVPPATPQVRLVQVKMQLVRLIGRAGVRPPAEQPLAVRPAAARRAQAVAHCLGCYGNSW